MREDKSTQLSKENRGGLSYASPPEDFAWHGVVFDTQPQRPVLSSLKQRLFRRNNKDEQAISPEISHWKNLHKPEDARYLLSEKPIGKGGVGTVFKAFDRKMNSFAAIKKIAPIVGNETLELEAKALERSKKALTPFLAQRVVEVKDFLIQEEENTNTGCIVMEYLDPREYLFLNEVPGSRIKPQQLSSIVSDLAITIDALADKDIFPGDLKPANIAVNKETLETKLIDFGGSNLVEMALKNGAVTPLYVSPEIAAQSLERGSRIHHTLSSETWSLAVISFVLLTGESPHPNMYPFVLMEMISEQDGITERMQHVLTKYAEQNNLNSNKLLEVFNKAFKNNPQDRYVSSQEFAESFSSAVMENKTKRVREAN